MCIADDGDPYVKQNSLDSLLESVCWITTTQDSSAWGEKGSLDHILPPYQPHFGDAQFAGTVGGLGNLHVERAERSAA
jgi:hypothetical protein